MEHIQIGNVSLEMRTAGEGRPLLFLHGGDYFTQNRAFLERLAQRWRVLIPRHPGFGGTERPDGFRSVNDLAYLYLDLIERQRLSDVVLVGSSFGGWVALEICVRSVERIGRLALIDTLGVKFGGREQRDIADIYALPADEVLRRTFFDPSRVAPDYAQIDDAEAASIASDRAATALYGWRPYMHNPGLRGWFHRVRAPTLVVWGQGDGIVSPDYGKTLCRALPDASFQLIPEAGHYPQIERPELVADAIESFARAEVKS
jgi:pimeloyl-ACP methyl ester carboxylesterase